MFGYQALFLFVLILVHIQFKYCSTVGICFLKLLETAFIVFCIQVYMQYDELEMPFNMTIFDGLANKWETLSSASAHFGQFSKESL